MTNDVIEHITLELKREKYKHTISAKKNDTNVRRVQAIITDNGAIVELDLVALAVVKAIKPDGTRIYNDCAISGNTIWFTMTQQMLAAPGDVTCEIEITWADMTVVSTPTFTVHVYDTLNTGVESTNEYNGIIQALARAESAETTATNKAGEATSSATASGNSALVSEGYATGTQDGVPVGSGTYYHNNAKYYSEQAEASATEVRSYAYSKSEIDDLLGAMDTEIDGKQDALTAGTNITIDENNEISSETTGTLDGERLILI